MKSPPLILASVCAALTCGFGAGDERSGAKELTAVSTASPKAAPPFENSLGMRFVSVPGVDVMFSVYETRLKDFTAFAQDTGFQTDRKIHTWIEGVGKVREGFSWDAPGFDQGPTHPVGAVSWNDAKAFCRWLTMKERAAGVLTGTQRYRLPSDVEWSIAAGLSGEVGRAPADRAGKIKTVYPWGNDWPPPSRAGNYGGAGWPSPNDFSDHDDGYLYSAPVGTFPPNRHGLHDMGGNVYEWCEDLEYKPGDNHRVMRGGGFNTRLKSMMPSSTRIHFDPDNRAANHGFRCVLELSAPK